MGGPGDAGYAAKTLDVGAGKAVDRLPRIAHGQDPRALLPVLGRHGELGLGQVLALVDEDVIVLPPGLQLPDEGQVDHVGEVDHVPPGQVGTLREQEAVGGVVDLQFLTVVFTFLLGAAEYSEVFHHATEVLEGRPVQRSAVFVVDVQQALLNAELEVLLGKGLALGCLPAEFITQLVQLGQGVQVGRQLALHRRAAEQLPVLIVAQLEAPALVSVGLQDAVAQAVDRLYGHRPHPPLPELAANLGGDAVVESAEQHPLGIGREAGALHHRRGLPGAGHRVDNAVALAAANEVENFLLFRGESHRLLFRGKLVIFQLFVGGGAGARGGRGEGGVGSREWVVREGRPTLAYEGVRGRQCHGIRVEAGHESEQSVAVSNCRIA